MTFASRMQHLIYWGPLRKPVEWSLKTVLAPWAYIASVLYHDSFWYPWNAERMTKQVLASPWGRLFQNWERLHADADGFPDVGERTRDRAARRRAGAGAVGRHPRHLHQGSARVRQPPRAGGGRRRIDAA